MTATQVYAVEQTMAAREQILKAMADERASDAYQLCLSLAFNDGDSLEGAEHLVGLAKWLDHKDLDLAIAAREKALEVLKRLNADVRLRIDCIENLVEALVANGQDAEAETCLREAMSLTLDHEGQGSGAYRDQLDYLADLLEARSGSEEASELLRDKSKALARQFGAEADRNIQFDLDGVTNEGAGRRVAAVNIFYATSRNPLKRTNPYRRFGGRRHETINFGIAQVLVPKDRRPGDFSGPGWIERILSLEDHTKFWLAEMQPIGVAGWLDRLREQVGGSDRREILLYVHGFNVEFWEAMLRAAQLHVDLGINGATVAYSWPSRGSAWLYDSDRSSIGVCWPEIKELIKELAKPLEVATGAEKQKPRLIVLAHSMGCDYTLNALERLSNEFKQGLLGGNEPPISEIIFAAPDVDAIVFKRDVALVSGLARRVTVYCSEADKALWTSKSLVHLYERAGRKAEFLAGLGLDSIDTTTAPGALLWALSHSDYASTALMDIQAVLCGEAPPMRIYLDETRVGGGAYWGLNPRRLSTPEGTQYLAKISKQRGIPERSSKLAL